MAAASIFDFIGNWLRHRSYHKKLTAALSWPLADGQVNHWKVIPAARKELTGAHPCQIEAGFHFIVNGEYFGGYLYSVGLGQHAADTLSKGTPKLKVRYDPANPNSNIALPVDNPDTTPESTPDNLPFRISSNPPDN
jgi:hypothetical protein